MHFDFAVAPSILDLAIVLSAVTSAAPVYNLETMCYWYARMVFEGTAESFNGRIEPGQCPEHRGRFTRGIRLVEKDGQFRLGVLAYVPWIRRSLLIALPTRLDLLSEVTRLREEMERAWYHAEGVEAAGDGLIAAAEESLTAEQLEDSEVRIFLFSPHILIMTDIWLVRSQACRSAQEQLPLKFFSPSFTFGLPGFRWVSALV